MQLETVTTKMIAMTVFITLKFHFYEPHADSVCWSKDQLDAYGLVQHVSGATYMHSHMLDVVIICGVSSIQDTPVAVNSSLCCARDNQYGYHLGMKTTPDC